MHGSGAVPGTTGYWDASRGAERSCAERVRAGELDDMDRWTGGWNRLLEALASLLPAPASESADTAMESASKQRIAHFPRLNFMLCPMLGYSFPICRNCPLSFVDPTSTCNCSSEMQFGHWENWWNSTTQGPHARRSRPSPRTSRSAPRPFRGGCPSVEIWTSSDKVGRAPRIAVVPSARCWRGVPGNPAVSKAIDTADALLPHSAISHSSAIHRLAGRTVVGS